MKLRDVRYNTEQSRFQEKRSSKVNELIEEVASSSRENKARARMKEGVWEGGQKGRPSRSSYYY